MTHMWDSLPPELYLRIIYFIDSPLQIKQCRLVCRNWNHPDARYAQLVSNIFLTTIEDTRLFLEYMKKHDTKGRFVRMILLGNTFHWDKTLLALMDIVITPHLEIMYGQLPYNEDLFYTKLNTILAKTPAASWKLQVIPANKLFTQSYFNALLSLKPSLETIYLDLHHCARNTHLDKDLIMRHLATFPRLTKLSLKGTFILQHLVDLLQACQHLVDLYLEPQLQDEQSILLQAHNDPFKVLDTLKTFKIGKYAPIQVVELVMSVHPHVQYAAINAPWYYSGSMEATLNLLKAVKHVPYYEMNCIFGDRDNTTLDDVINIIKSDRNHASVSHLDHINHLEIIICSRYVTSTCVESF